MVQENRASIDCACVIHGSAYDWQYVENLYNMLERNMLRPIRFHVYTEPDRPVPEYMIKHSLAECPAANVRKRGWWYKMQLFNQEHFTGNLLYLDLDLVVIRDLTWITDLPSHKLWAIRDFKYLQNENLYQINSSVMWWNVSTFDWLWQKFKNSDPATEAKRHNGDQDYIDKHVEQRARAYFPTDSMLSWRWQLWEGGLQFPYNRTKYPGAGAIIPDSTSVLVFHGQPKPHELLDNVVIKQHWC